MTMTTAVFGFDNPRPGSVNKSFARSCLIWHTHKRGRISKGFLLFSSPSASANFLFQPILLFHSPSVFVYSFRLWTNHWLATDGTRRALFDPILAFQLSRFSPHWSARNINKCVMLHPEILLMSDCLQRVMSEWKCEYRTKRKKSLWRRWKIYPDSSTFGTRPLWALIQKEGVEEKSSKRRSRCSKDKTLPNQPPHSFQQRASFVTFKLPLRCLIT